MKLIYNRSPFSGNISLLFLPEWYIQITISIFYFSFSSLICVLLLKRPSFKHIVLKRTIKFILGQSGLMMNEGIFYLKKVNDKNEF